MVYTTALGMTQYPGMAFEADQIDSQDWTLEAVYTPTWTEFISTAKDSWFECLTSPIYLNTWLFTPFKHTLELAMNYPWQAR